MKTRVREKPDIPTRAAEINEASGLTQTPAPKPEPIPTPAPDHASHHEHDDGGPQIELRKADRPAPPVAQKIEVAKPTKTSHSSHEPVKGIDAEQSLRWLKNGNTRFVTGRLRADGQSQKDVKRLSKGQSPHAIVISCSDSRVPPEVVFDQKLGELFVVRTAGETLDPGVIGSIEYAASHLGARLILVMGHTSCGAVRAAVETINGGDLGSENLNHLVADLHPHIRDALSQAGAPSKDLARETWANAKGVADDLLKRSPILKKAVESGNVKVHTALYHLDSGQVHFE